MAKIMALKLGTDGKTPFFAGQPRLPHFFGCINSNLPFLSFVEIAYPLSHSGFSCCNSTVTDSTTGLVWQQQDDNEMRTWDESTGHCNAFSLGGFLPRESYLVSRRGVMAG